MIDHVSTYATDYLATKAFYEGALAPLGFTLQQELVATWDEDFPDRRACAFGPPGKTVFWVIEARSAVDPRHIAFSAQDRAAVDAFFEGAIGAGGSDNGGPGPRPVYHEHYYGAFVLDPDGNNVEAVCHAAA